MQHGEGCDERLVQAPLIDAVFFQRMFSFWKERNVSPDSYVAGVATQMTDVPALVTRFCVQLLLERGATTSSSLTTAKTS